MAVSMHQASTPVFTRGLRNLSTLLTKAEGHAEERGYAPEVLINARLAPDMLPLSGQVQRASDTSKASVVRLTGVEAPRFPDEEKTFAELQTRIAHTIAFIEGVDPAAFDGAEQRTIELKFGAFAPSLAGDAFLFRFALPNFFFHLVTAHDILRHNGLAVGKLDYLGPFE
ncbi:MAG: hypothetical protein JWP92_1933 [Caulobacter sp.]|nr:hypothetical protein [Caulobacter sp.]